jgi:WhiB family redox-sensing transcriptional regulator
VTAVTPIDLVLWHDITMRGTIRRDVNEPVISALRAFEEVVRSLPDWTDDALCAQVGGDLFYPEKGGDVRGPRKVCDACPVEAACLEWALDHGGFEELGSWGFWGGKSMQEREAMVKARRKQESEAA